MNRPPSPSREPEVLLFETSPFGTLDAIVQHDGKSVYFYMNEAKPESDQIFGTRACWVRNLQAGPLVINDNEMRQGISPMLPKTHCVHRDPQPLPDSGRLRIVWLEEGNGAALLEDDPESQTSKTLAVIPPWSGLDGFHGYSDQCAIESPLCWPMPDNPKLEQRIRQADQFWKSFHSDIDPFQTLQDDLLAAYDAQFLKPVSSDSDPTDATETPIRSEFQIDGGQFPPRRLIQYQTHRQTIIATVGMSLCPQPAVEIFSDHPKQQRRVELAIRVNANLGDGGSPDLEQLRGQLSGLAGYPWRKFTWFGAGHTCSFPGIAAANDTVRLIAESQLVVPNRKPIAMPSFRDDPINLLWLEPTP